MPPDKRPRRPPLHTASRASQCSRCRRAEPQIRTHRRVLDSAPPSSRPSPIPTPRGSRLRLGRISASFFFFILGNSLMGWAVPDSGSRTNPHLRGPAAPPPILGSMGGCAPVLQCPLPRPGDAWGVRGAFPRLFSISFRSRLPPPNPSQPRPRPRLPGAWLQPCSEPRPHPTPATLGDSPSSSPLCRSHLATAAGE